jgi:hypothetical protein
LVDLQQIEQMATLFDLFVLFVLFDLFPARAELQLRYSLSMACFASQRGSTYPSNPNDDASPNPTAQGEFTKKK